jgi:phosphoenolpyruvate carboxykinase (ATP)
MVIVSIARYSSHNAATCRPCVPSTPRRSAFRVVFVLTTKNPTSQSTHRFRQASTRSTATTLRVRNDVKMALARGIKEASDPVIRTASPAPFAQDFARQQVSKQQRSNFHSTSLSPLFANTMVSQVPAVNKTNLHPGGLQYVTSSAPIILFRIC